MPNIEEKQMKDEALTTCSLCGSDLTNPAKLEHSVYHFQCKLCGNVAIHQQINPDQIKDSLHLLSGWTRERTEKKEKTLTILPNDIGPETEGITIDAILKLPGIPYTITDRMHKLMESIYRKSPYFGAEIGLASYRDYPLAYMEHIPEHLEQRHPFHKIMEQIIQKGWITQSSTHKYYLTAAGIEHLEKIRQSNPESRDCFVAMKFGDEFLDQAYKDGIAPAIEKAGYRPVQMAYVEHNNNILDEMVAAIRRSRLLVADLTRQNQNVYFEAGFAHGLGIPVIYTCFEDDAANIRFDTQQFSQIRWASVEDLAIKLKNRILATIG
jgi:hypothetical protein